MKSVESVDYMEQAPRALPFLNSDKIECNLVHWLPEILILMVLFGCFVWVFFFSFLRTLGYMQGPQAAEDGGRRESCKCFLKVLGSLNRGDRIEAKSLIRKSRGITVKILPVDVE